MTEAAAQLQKGIFATLTGDVNLAARLGAGRIFDTLPDRVRQPYVVLGRSTVSDWSTATEDGETVVFFIHVWTRSGGRRENHRIQGDIKTALASGEIGLDDHVLVNLRFQLAETRHDRTTGLIHGIMRFRAVLEPVV